MCVAESGDLAVAVDRSSWIGSDVDNDDADGDDDDGGGGGGDDDDEGSKEWSGREV